MILMVLVFCWGEVIRGRVQSDSLLLLIRNNIIKTMFLNYLYAYQKHYKKLLENVIKYHFSATKKVKYHWDFLTLLCYENKFRILNN